jgi:chromosome segregation ATPase
MKTFKTIEEIIEYISDKENIATLESGEITLKEWVELGKSTEKYKKDHEQVVTDRKALRGKNDELTKKVAELTEQLNSVSNELMGLKEVHTGSDKDALQKLNKANSELIGKLNAAESKNCDYEKQVSRIPELEKQVESYKAASNRSRILEAVRKVAAQRKVPQQFIDDSDFERLVVEDFIIDEQGNIFSKGDSPQSVDNYIASKQKEKHHWMPTSQGGSGNDPMKSVSDIGTYTDAHAAIAALFD